MEPQLEFLAGERKFKARMRDRQSRIAIAANNGEIKNIMIDVPINPTRLVCQEKYLNAGLK